MARAKQYVFSARTPEARLRALGEVKARLNVGWDKLVIGAVAAHYGLDWAMMTLPKKEAPAKHEQANEPPPAEQTDPERPAEEGKSAEAPAKKRGKKAKKGTQPEAAA